MIRTHLYSSLVIHVNLLIFLLNTNSAVICAKIQKLEKLLENKLFFFLENFLYFFKLKSRKLFNFFDRSFIRSTDRTQEYFIFCINNKIN